MLRAIASVIVGYLVLAALTMVFFTITFLSLGVDRTFYPGTYRSTPLWDGLALTISAFVALAGGAVCRLIARSRRPVYVLASIYLILGLTIAIMELSAADPGPRPPTVTSMDAARNTKQPLWYAFTIPFVGALFVTLGGSLVRRQKV